jgi:hypothetical protein
LSDEWSAWRCVIHPLLQQLRALRRNLLSRLRGVSVVQRVDATVRPGCARRSGEHGGFTGLFRGLRVFHDASVDVRAFELSGP